MEPGHPARLFPELFSFFDIVEDSQGKFLIEAPD